MRQRYMYRLRYGLNVGNIVRSSKSSFTYAVSIHVEEFVTA